MASEQTFSTHDLRSGAKEFARDKEHRVKWAHGEAFGPGRRAEDARPRPAKVASVPKSTVGFNKARTALKNDIAEASGDSSADEDVEEASAAPVPDADITYSFDAARGPSHGSQVLGYALDKAMEKFEVRQTDKLIKDEYEVLDADGEAVGQKSKAAGKKPIAVDEDDYEIVEA